MVDIGDLGQPVIIRSGHVLLGSCNLCILSAVHDLSAILLSYSSYHIITTILILYSYLRIYLDIYSDIYLDIYLEIT